MKIYTKKGDRGETSLFGGQKVDKNSLRVEAYGKVDELNSLLGVIISEDAPKNVFKKMARIQNELFILGTDLATPIDIKIKVPRIKKNFTTKLEKEIDTWEKELPKLKNFIVPGGSRAGSKLHLARATSRCLERIVVALDRSDRLNPTILPYVNRLSDWFFVLARHTNFMANSKETVWKGRS
jgi:cob(I)alamin adenosyltransferase